MKKHLDAANIMNELRGQSAFFPQTKEDTKQEKVTSPLSVPQQEIEKPAPERYHDTMTPSNHATTVSPDDEIIEKARKAVKHVGKEAATHRFTLEEKNMLADIEYSYRRLGIRTSENEITRIAINYFVEDYRKNGEQSLLARVLKSLNS